ncbi:DNA polymerase III subunit gamma/tau [Psychrobacter arenosus]|uniref:DNA polymerase III subunit gamma/tau n=1 Tax=Psychrobacter arenosus TaxID=256326 RepID=UPI0019194B54|nr:DNA polymerase III subunit gamma/tau [Psychrobacter arenosus]
MSQQYQVLARKYRPKNFHELIGQDHVSHALINAIDYERLHHAYLFTGTRGVGKTTIARILSKCLNCDTGVTSKPCGVCDNCVAIDEGRFIDLIEIDAASRTKVEDTRELLDNVPYAPTQGRYKVYLIDEVHMLSTHSFNALLKTLEEPPAHVKFLLATTDPQKLPITIISRCLQFVLRPLPQALLSEHLANILTQEHVTYSDPALWQLANAAKGSVRDALSLTDQAIAFGQGSLTDDTVNNMLGLINSADLLSLLADIYSNNRSAVAAQIQQMRLQMVDASGMFDGLAELLHQMALVQLLPEIALGLDERQEQAIIELANRISPEVLQLYYEIVVQAREGIRLANTPMQSLEMCLLRLLAFRPLSDNEVAVTPVVPPSATPQITHTANEPVAYDSSIVAENDGDNELNNNQHSQTDGLLTSSEEPNAPVTESALANEPLSDNNASAELTPQAESLALTPVVSEAANNTVDDAQTLTNSFSDNEGFQAVEASSIEEAEPLSDSEPDGSADNFNNQFTDSFNNQDTDSFNNQATDNKQVADLVDNQPVTDYGAISDVTTSQYGEAIAEGSDAQLMESPVAESNAPELALSALEVAPAAVIEPTVVDTLSNSISQAEPELLLQPESVAETELLAQPEPVAQPQPTVDPIQPVEPTQALAVLPDDPRSLLKCPPQTLAGEWTVEKWDYWLQSARENKQLAEDELALARQGVMTGLCNGEATFLTGVNSPHLHATFAQLITKLQDQFPNTQITLQVDASIGQQALSETGNGRTPEMRQKQRLKQAETVATQKLQQSPVMQYLTNLGQGQMGKVKIMGI